MFQRRISRAHSSRGFSLIELLIVIAIILIIITIAVPKYQQTMRFTRETAAIAAIKTIHQMEVQYQSQYGRYATSLTELGPPQSGSGAPTPSAADLIPGDLAQGIKQGYKFSLTGNQAGYVINANPINYPTDGSRTFFSDQSMVIRENFGPEPATASSKELGMK